MRRKREKKAIEAVQWPKTKDRGCTGQLIGASVFKKCKCEARWCWKKSRLAEQTFPGKLDVKSFQHLTSDPSNPTRNWC